MENIFIDENNSCKFDLSSADWFIDNLNEIFHASNVPLKDVDFIVNDTDNGNILLVEYKNAIHSKVVNPNSFKPLEDKYINSVVDKYYDSIWFLNAVEKCTGKKKIYVYIVEAPKGDVALRYRIFERLKARLPFKLQEQNNFKENMIDKLYVLNIDEWNKYFGKYNAERLA